MYNRSYMVFDGFYLAHVEVIVCWRECNKQLVGVYK